jgi:hypothetical protein
MARLAGDFTILMLITFDVTGVQNSKEGRTAEELSPTD